MAEEYGWFGTRQDHGGLLLLVTAHGNLIIMTKYDLIEGGGKRDMIMEAEMGTELVEEWVKVRAQEGDFKNEPVTWLNYGSKDSKLVDSGVLQLIFTFWYFWYVMRDFLDLCVPGFTWF